MKKHSRSKIIGRTRIQIKTINRYLSSKIKSKYNHRKLDTESKKDTYDSINKQKLKGFYYF